MKRSGDGEDDHTTLSKTMLDPIRTESGGSNSYQFTTYIGGVLIPSYLRWSNEPQCDTGAVQKVDLSAAEAFAAETAWLRPRNPPGGNTGINKSTRPRSCIVSRSYN